MKIIFRGGYNKLDPESVKKSTLFEYAPLIHELHSNDEKVAIVTVAKSDGYYDSLIDPIKGYVEIIDTANIEKTEWGKYKLIILMGGDTVTLHEWLKKGKFAIDVLRPDATIIGDSAGAMVLGSDYYDFDRENNKISFKKGLREDSKLITIVHANNPHYAPDYLVKEVTEYAKKNSLQIIKLNENQFVTHDLWS